MKHEISEQRLAEQKEENHFVREATYPGMNDGGMIEYFGGVGLFACRINGKIFACDP